jgi:hypothetical protein
MLSQSMYAPDAKSSPMPQPGFCPEEISNRRRNHDEPRNPGLRQSKKVSLAVTVLRVRSEKRDTIPKPVSLGFCEGGERAAVK